MHRMPALCALAFGASLGALLLAGACGGSTTTGGDGGAASSDASAGADGSADTATTVDGAACVNIDAASFSHVCTADVECTTIAVGTLCTGGCACGGASIARSDIPKYTTATSGIETLACPCAFPGQPRCVHGACVLCSFGPGSAPGCPDGG